MLNLLIIFSEALTMLIWLHIVFKTLLNQSKGKVMFVVLYVTYFYVTTELATNFWIDVIPVLCMLIWSRIQFQEKSFWLVIRFIFAVLGLSVMQLALLEGMYLIDLKIYKIGLVGIYVVASVMCVIITYGIYIIQNRKKFTITKPDKTIVSLSIYILLIILVMLFVKYDYEKHNGAYSDLYIILYLLLVLCIMVIIRELKAKHRLEQKQLELDLRKGYGEAYDKLIMEMRRKQHDYKNQLSAIYSTQFLSGDELKLSVEGIRYVDELIKNDKFDNILISCDNPVLSGYIYTQCSRADRLNIDVKTSIVCTDREYKVPLHEIIEMLGILINNSIEYLSVRDSKRMKIKVFDKVDSIHLEVANNAEYIPYNELEKMFSVGYSSKGDERGIGLYSLKRIVNKYKGELLVENVLEANENWIRIKVVI